MAKRLLFGLLLVALLIGMAGADMTFSYTTAGNVTGTTGKVFQSVDTTARIVGNHTSMSSYGSRLSGSGSMEIVSTTAATGYETTGTIGVMIQDGRVNGQAKNFLNQMFIGENVTVEETAEGETIVLPSEICDPVTPEELDFQNQYCEEAQSESSFYLTTGQAGIQSITTIPPFSSTLSNEIVVDGKGSATSAGKYVYLSGANFTADTKKEFSGKTRMYGAQGIQFGSEFVYKTLHG